MQERTTLTRNQLYELVWQKPMSRLAADYAMSDRGLAKLCARHNIPTPPRGYWAQLEVGQAPRRPRLPAEKDASPIHLPVGQSEDDDPRDEVAAEVAEEKQSTNRIVVADRLQSPCTLIAEAKVALEDAKTDAVGLIERPAGCLAIRASRAALPRTLRIADALLKSFADRGWEVVVEKKETIVHVGEVRITIAFDEGITTEERQLQPDLSGDYAFHHKRHETTRKPSGRVSIAILEEQRLWQSALRRKWHDSQRRPLEDHLNDVVVGMIKLAAAVRAEIARQERARQEQMERERQLQIALQEQSRLRTELAAERARIDALRKQADRWCESQNIRLYVEHARERGQIPEMRLEGPDLDRWAEWALRQADRLDPLAPSPPSIIDEAERIEHMCDQLQRRWVIPAASLEELEPLLAMCRAGKLFEIVEWVKQGRPVAVPDDSGSKGAHRNPLRIAMDRGFHSLVKVLLEAGAPHRVGKYDALSHAVELRRPDLAVMLIRHGARVADVSMQEVIERWEPEMVNLFLSNGADLQLGNPVAWGLIHKMRPALGLLKRFGEASPDLMKQAEFALRFHAFEGSVKWVSLLLWAGADPWASGSVNPDDDEDCLNAFEWAATAGKLEVLQLKKLVAARDPERPESIRLLGECRSSEMLAMLLAEGHRPQRLPDQGTRAINSFVYAMTWEFYDASSYMFTSQPKKRIDSSRARDKLKMLHMLVAHGAKWLPEDKQTIGDVRRNLLKMAPDYLLEFLWLMHKYGAARKRDVEELLRTPSVRQLLEQNLSKATQLVAGIPEDL